MSYQEVRDLFPEAGKDKVCYAFHIDRFEKKSESRCCICNKGRLEMSIECMLEGNQCNN